MLDMTLVLAAGALAMEHHRCAELAVLPLNQQLIPKQREDRRPLTDFGPNTAYGRPGIWQRAPV